MYIYIYIYIYQGVTQQFWKDDVLKELRKNGLWPSQRVKCVLNRGVCGALKASW